MAFKSKEVQRKYHRKYYKKNKQYCIDKAKRYRAKKWEWFRELKEGLKCEKCGEKTPICLDFHHKDPDIKFMNVSKMVNDCWSEEEILIEIDKCNVLCANCHRKLRASVA